jgi:predicted ATPase/class 3 adenylate cyclase
MTEPNAPVTFLLTDVQGSTRMWQAHPEEMSAAMRLLDETVERVVGACDGRLVKLRGEGDSHFCVFNDPKDAVIAARDLQLSLAATSWPTPDPIAIRASIHTGRVEFRAPDYYGTEVNRAARIRSLAHGGQTLTSMTTLALVSSHLPPDVTFRDLGTHRLKDIADPEQIFQLCHPKLPSEFPPLRASDQGRHNLPMQATSFVGRHKELGELARLVRDRRLVTIVGPGGSGKSRIAVETGRGFVDEFADGVWFVELVADVVRMPERTDVTVAEALVDFLKPRALLLLVDNAEHVIDAVAALVEHIHRFCERVHVVVTTREALRLDGEYVWPLGPLATVDLDELPPLDTLAATEAVQLFVDRARQLQPVFALGADNARPIAEICHRLDGIPLAIELATARVPSLGVEHVASRLDDVFRVLTGGRRTAVARQRTLRATIDWSYDLLDEHERKLLERLSIFVGGCTLGAAEAVCSGDGLAVEDVDDLISSLVAKSLVGTDTATGQVRYRLLETVRQYAAEKLMASGSMRDLRDRHLRWFVTLSETNPPPLDRSDSW